MLIKLISLSVLLLLQQQKFTCDWKKCWSSSAKHCKHAKRAHRRIIISIKRKKLRPGVIYEIMTKMAKKWTELVKYYFQLVSSFSRQTTSKRVYSSSLADERNTTSKQLQMLAFTFPHLSSSPWAAAVNLPGKWLWMLQSNSSKCSASVCLNDDKMILLSASLLLWCRL